MYLRQSTSTVIMLGCFVDATDGITPMTALSLANTDIQLFKHTNSGTTWANKNTGTSSHSAGGWYAVTLNATDTNTLGRLQIYCNKATAAPVWSPIFTVVPANYFDSVILGTDYLQTDVIQVAGSTTAGTNLSIGSQSVIYGTAVTGTLSTDAFTVSGLSTNVAANDRLIGRTVTFYGSASIAGEQAVILDYVRATDTTGTITVSTGSTPMSDAPANADTFYVS